MNAIHHRRTTHRLAAAIGLALSAAFVPLTSHAVKFTGGEYNTLYAGLGAKGYDVVAYFTDNKPVKGSDRYSADFGGVTWHFASRENRDRFAADPARYAPQYGGFCSWGVAQGKLFDVDPENGWHVANGKLYLNFNADINKTFTRDVDGFVAKAERNFPALNR
jgi:YHS domain-containing protein